MRAYLVFGRDSSGERPYAPWWPLYIEDGPHMGDSPDAVLDVIRERLELGGEMGTWVELAAVPVSEWKVRAADTAEATS